MLTIRIYWYYLKAAIAYLISPESREGLSFKSLFKTSFKLPYQAYTDRLVGYKIVYKCLARLSTNRFSNYNEIAGEYSVIYDGRKEGLNSRTRFIKYYNPKVPRLLGLYRNEIIGYSTLIELAFLFFATLFIGFFTALIVLVLGPKKYLNIALLPLNILETCGLFLNLKQLSNTKEVYYFNVYEQNSNIDAIIAMDLNISFIKVSSEVPLALANSVLIADILVLCIPYQYEEIAHYPSIHVNKTQLFGPENIVDQRLFLKAENDEPISKLAFYSSGNWLREKLNHVDLGIDAVQSEEKLLNWLIQIAEERNIDLSIYIHPLEKQLANKELTVNYYNKFKSEGHSIEIVNWNASTSEMYCPKEIAISLYSTILFERIFLGYASLIVPMGLEDNFPIKASNLNLICSSSLNETRLKIEQSFGLTNCDFFHMHKLNAYRGILK